MLWNDNYYVLKNITKQIKVTQGHIAGVDQASYLWRGTYSTGATVGVPGIQGITFQANGFRKKCVDSEISFTKLVNKKVKFYRLLLEKNELTNICLKFIQNENILKFQSD